LSSIGLYPLIPGTAGFSLNLPQFKNIKIDLPTNTLIIKNEGEDLKTIKSVYLNGEKMNSLWLELDQIDGGGIIQLNKLN
jgi:putative alpha-1,2-mannosidase